MPQTVYLASDALGAQLSEAIAAHLQEKHSSSLSVQQLGTFDKYYEAAHKAGGLVQASRASGGHDIAILTCGTGMGMSIIANKAGDAVFAACVESVSGAANAAAINNANVLCLGGLVFTAEEAIAAVDKWLSTGFTEGYEQYKEFLEASMTEIPAMLNSPEQDGDASKASTGD